MSTLLGDGGYSTISEVRLGLKKLQNGTVDFPFIIEDTDTDNREKGSNSNNTVNLADANSSGSDAAVGPDIIEVTSEGTSEGTSSEELSADDRSELIDALNAVATSEEDFEDWELDSSDEEGDPAPATGTTGTAGTSAGKKERQSLQMRLAASQKSYENSLKSNADDEKTSSDRLREKLDKKKQAAKEIIPDLDVQTPYLLEEVNSQLGSVYQAYDSKIDSANKAFDEKFNSPTYKTDGSGNIVKNAKGKDQFEFKPLEEVEWHGSPALLIESKKGTVFDLPKEGDRILDMVWPAGVWSRKLTFTKGGNPTFYTKDDAKGHKKGDPKLDKDGNPLLTKDKTDLYIKFTPTEPYTLQRDDGSGSTVVGPDEQQKYIQFRTFDTQLLSGKPYQPTKKLKVPFLEEWFKETSRNNFGELAYKHYFAGPQLKDFGHLRARWEGDEFISKEDVQKEAYERAKAEWGNPAKKEVNALVQERNEKVKVLNKLKSALENFPRKLQQFAATRKTKDEEAKLVKEKRDERENNREAEYVGRMEAKRQRREKRERDRVEAREKREKAKRDRKEKHRAKLEATKKFNEERNHIKEEFTRKEAAVMYPSMTSMERESSDLRKEAMLHKDKAIARFVPGTELFRVVKGKKTGESTYTETQYRGTVVDRGVVTTVADGGGERKITCIDVEYIVGDESTIARYCVVGTVRKHGFHWERAELMRRGDRTSVRLVKDKLRERKPFTPPRYKTRKDGTQVELKKVVVKSIEVDVEPSKYVQSRAVKNWRPLKRWSAVEKSKVDADGLPEVAVPFEVGRAYFASTAEDGQLGSVVTHTCTGRDNGVVTWSSGSESLVNVENRVEKALVGGATLLSTNNSERLELRRQTLQRKYLKQAFDRKVTEFVERWKANGAKIGSQYYTKDAAKAYLTIDLATHAYVRLQNMGVAPSTDYGNVSLDDEVRTSIDALGKLKFSSKNLTGFDIWYAKKTTKDELSNTYLENVEDEDMERFVKEDVVNGVLKKRILLPYAEAKWLQMSPEEQKKFEEEAAKESREVDLSATKQTIFSVLEKSVDFDKGATTQLIETLLKTKVLLKGALASLSIGEEVNENLIASLQHGFFVWLQETVDLPDVSRSRREWHKDTRKKIATLVGASDEEARAAEEEERFSVNHSHRLQEALTDSSSEPTNSFDEEEEEEERRESSSEDDSSDSDMFGGDAAKDAASEAGSDSESELALDMFDE